MSIAAAPAPAPPGSTAGDPPVAGEACPLCGAPLRPEQEWCLRCGAAARTRLAAAPNWRAPLIAALAVAVLSLGVLAAALVGLVGDSGPAPPARTNVVTVPATASTPAQTAITPAPGATSTTTPGARTVTTPAPGAKTTAPLAGASTTTTHAGARANGTEAGTGAGLTPLLSKRLEELRRKRGTSGK